MIDHTAILSGALFDYNDWVVKQTNVSVVPAELRGIFYNKLITRLKDGYDSIDLRAAIKPDHLVISFTSRGYIASLSFVNERHAYTASLRNQILDGLEKALVEIDVTSFQDKFSYELSKVILEAKKCFNYGRQQTPRGGSE